MLVVVLDQVALYVFKADGSLKSKTFVDVAKRYRGLARHPGLGRLVTTEKVEGMGTYIVFIDEDTFEKVVMRTLIEPTAATEYYIQVPCSSCHRNIYRSGSRNGTQVLTIRLHFLMLYP